MMRSRAAIVFFLLLVAVIVAGCGQKSADLQDAAVPPDTALFVILAEGKLSSDSFIDSRGLINASLLLQ